MLKFRLTMANRFEKKSFDYAALEAYYNDLRDNKAKLLGDKAEKLKVPTELAKKRDDYLKNHLVGLGPAAIEGLKAKVAKFDYSILGHQISVNAYNIVDRCEVCHVGIREPLDLKPENLAPDGPGKTPDDLARAFVSHPNREILAIHNPDKFGCSGCHWGNGRATTSDVKGHGRHRFWLWPMFEKENTEAGCQQCHAKDRVTDGAETLNLGRDLFSQRGCMGCHRYEGFDRETDSLNSTRQQIGQLEDQITANEKTIRYAENPGSEVSDVEANALLVKANALRVQNSLLAARIDQLNVQSKYLMQDVKKVGPNLKDVRLKLVRNGFRFGWRIHNCFVPKQRCQRSGALQVGTVISLLTCVTRMAKNRFRQLPRISGKTASMGNCRNNKKAMLDTGRHFLSRAVV
jgi:hypothetical protein